jgi:hypothetical protein
MQPKRVGMGAQTNAGAPARGTPGCRTGDVDAHRAAGARDIRANLMPLRVDVGKITSFPASLCVSRPRPTRRPAAAPSIMQIPATLQHRFGLHPGGGAGAVHRGLLECLGNVVQRHLGHVAGHLRRNLPSCLAGSAAELHSRRVSRVGLPPTTLPPSADCFLSPAVILGTSVSDGLIVAWSDCKAKTPRPRC